VAVLEAGGYKTLNDIIDLEREDFLKLAGIAPEEADRLMAFINEVTADGTDGGASEGGTPEVNPTVAGSTAEAAAKP
jgi:N utilization substance protein A